MPGSRQQAQHHQQQQWRYVEGLAVVVASQLASQLAILRSLKGAFVPDPLATTRYVCLFSTISWTSMRLVMFLQREPRRLLSTPSLPKPPGTTRLVARERRTDEGGDEHEANLVKTVMQQIGTLKISSSAGTAVSLRRSNTTPERREAHEDDRAWER